jgi:3-oxoacyl-[acyl-carrier protein] reductase
MELEGRVALVTGASRGMGRAIALKLGSMGAMVAVNYVAIDQQNETDARNVVAELEKLGVKAMAVEADVRDGEAVKKMVDAVVEQWGAIHILINNAGITKDTLLLRMSEQQWDDVIDINLRGTFLCSKHALKTMIRQGWGRIVSLSSIAGVVGNPGQTNYSASKAGIIGFTKSLAREVGSRGITVNAVAPGFIRTAMTDALPEEARNRIVQMTSLQRAGTPEDVAEAIAFLASDRASYITGQVLGIDGGMGL